MESHLIALSVCLGQKLCENYLPRKYNCFLKYESYLFNVFSGRVESTTLSEQVKLVFTLPRHKAVSCSYANNSKSN